MTAIGKNQHFFALLLFLSIYTFHVMSLNLHAASMSERHEQWMKKYGVVYKDATEKQKRFLIFKDNVEYIESFNAVGNKSYKLGINPFTDQTNDEFRASHTGFKWSHELRTSQTSFKYENVTDDIPTAVDWRESGAVTPVKEQGKCDCCWAYSTVAAIEGIYKKASGNLLSFSVQQLVDCNAANNGCNGGNMILAFEYIKESGGITTEENYPYLEIEGYCDNNKLGSFKVQISGYERIPSNNEEAMLNAVANQPVSVGISSEGVDFQAYTDGVFTGECGTELDHAVAIVGYGATDDGTKYWIVKNSWGTEWGEEGYMRIARDTNNGESLCGIAIFVAYPYI
ncbi:Senescence-specific cysteine protease SAG12, partial [Mucuna pruriens]